MSLQHIVLSTRGNMEQAAAVTYTGSTSAVIFWGLHISDLAAIVSMAVAICGLALQFWVAMRRIGAVEKAQAKTEVRQDIAEIRVADVEAKTPITVAAAAITAATVAAARIRQAEVDKP